MTDITGSAGAVTGAAQASAATTTTTGGTTDSKDTINLNEKVSSFDTLPKEIKDAMMLGMATTFINDSYRKNKELIKHMKEAQRANDG